MTMEIYQWVLEVNSKLSNNSKQVLWLFTRHMSVSIRQKRFRTRQYVIIVLLDMENNIEQQMEMEQGVAMEQEQEE